MTPPLTRRSMLKGVGTAGAVAVAGCNAPTAEQRKNTETKINKTKPTVDRVAADPTDIPSPIRRDHSKTVDVTLETKEVKAEIEPGVTFNYMTFGEQIPGPFIRVRQGDTINLTFKNPKENSLPHNVDFHAVAGTGGGAEATYASPGETKHLKFKATYPGAYIYHCAVPTLDMHISAGMFGLILVEPKEGLPKVDHEFYLGQHEIYTDKSTGEEGHHKFDYKSMKAEDPSYVLLNGEKTALTGNRYGSMQVKKGETARVFFVVGGPNLMSSFHPIGNVWEKVYPQGSVSTTPQKHIQTTPVPPGSTSIATMDFPVPGDFKIVDHALSRVANKGCLAVVHADGSPEPEIFDPEPQK